MQTCLSDHWPSDLEKELLEVSRSLNSERIKRIADQITPDALYSLIKARENESMRAIIYVGLEFARIGNASEDMLKIVSATKQALGMIAQESKLNAARVKKYGINPEIQTAAKRKES